MLFLLHDVKCQVLPDGVKVSLSGHGSKCLYVRENESYLTFSPFESPVPTSVEDKWVRYEAAKTVS